MNREQYNKAKDIIEVLNRIDRVLSTTTTIHNHITTHKHSFKNGNIAGDIAVLAQCYVGEDFLKLLYDKKVELESKLKEL